MFSFLDSFWLLEDDILNTKKDLMQKKTLYYQKNALTCFYAFIWSLYLKNNSIYLLILIFWAYFICLFL